MLSDDAHVGYMYFLSFRCLFKYADILISIDGTLFMLTETIWLKKIQIFVNSVIPS